MACQEMAALGLYGAMASAVREQTRTIGIRMALGTTPALARRAVLGRAFRLTSIGVVTGVAGALLSSRLLAALLFEVRPTDPIALVGVCVVLVAVALAAAYLPARRAAKLDPAQALWSE